MTAPGEAPFSRHGHDVLEAARALLALPDVVGTPAQREEKLRSALDRLALAYGSVKSMSFPEGEQPEPPRAEYTVVRARFAAAFPGLGFYNAVLDLSEPQKQAEVTTGDALDDLADIALDLQEVLDRSKASIEDALWDFRFGFQTHWGAHLRWLQLYLHGRES